MKTEKVVEDGELASQLLQIDLLPTINNVDRCNRAMHENEIVDCRFDESGAVSSAHSGEAAEIEQEYISLSKAWMLQPQAFVRHLRQTFASRTRITAIPYPVSLLSGQSVTGSRLTLARANRSGPSTSRTTTLSVDCALAARDLLVLPKREEEDDERPTDDNKLNRNDHDIYLTFAGQRCLCFCLLREELIFPSRCLRNKVTDVSEDPLKICACRLNMDMDEDGDGIASIASVALLE